MGKTFGGLHHRMAHRLAGMWPRPYTKGWQVYTPLDVATTLVRLEKGETYALYYNNTVAHYIATCTILETCLVVDQRSGVRVTRRWWDQAVPYFRQETGRAAEGRGGL